MKVQEGISPLQWIEPLYTEAAASPRVYHSVTLVQDKILVWGGLDTNHEPCDATISMFNVSTMSWSTPAIKGEVYKHALRNISFFNAGSSTSSYA